MVQGLAFLSKKSWHTKNLANQEKVWMAEQQKAAEESKTKELARQIQQEREQEELDRISGKKSNRLDRGIDWMYQGGVGQAAEEDAKKKQEEFLLGKEYVPEGEAKGGDFTSFENTGISTVVASSSEHSLPAEVESSKPAAAPEVATDAAPVYDDGPSVAERNESFRVRHEDPMFFVSQKQDEKKSQIAKKKALYEKVVGGTASDLPSGERREGRRKSSRHHKESKKVRKRERKHHRKRREREERSDRKHRRRSRSRSRDRSSRRSDRDSHGHHDRDSLYDHERRHRSRSRSEEHGRRYDTFDYSSDDDYRKDYRPQRSDSDRTDDTGRHYGDRGDRQDHRDRQYERKNLPTPSGYGLQGSTTQYRRGDDLGPNQELLAKKRQVQDEARRQAREKTSRRRMTEAERQEALRTMQNSANRREVALNKAASYKPRAVLDDPEEGHSGNASFLTDVTKQAHGLQSGSSMATRVAQNRHSNQQADDSFL